jgi:predicted secreted protein
MMKTITQILTAAAATALIGGAAQAQSTPPTDTTASGATTADVTGDTAVNPDITTDNGLTADTSPAGQTPVTAPVAVAATTYAQGASVTTMTVTNGPIPDTAENRAKYGQPLSRTGRMTAARGN